MREFAAEKAKAVFRTYQPEPVMVVSTQGDWQPHNWLRDGTELRIIDFGRYGYRPATSDFGQYGYRPATSDFCRLAVQPWKTAPQLKSAFFEDTVQSGDGKLGNVMLLREAVAIALAYHVGDDELEEQGHKMLRDALANF